MSTWEREGITKKKREESEKGRERRGENIRRGKLGKNEGGGKKEMIGEWKTEGTREEGASYFSPGIAFVCI